VLATSNNGSSGAKGQSPGMPTPSWAAFAPNSDNEYVLFASGSRTKDLADIRSVHDSETYSKCHPTY